MCGFGVRERPAARMDHSGEPEPRVVQLAGADPEALAEAARRNIDLGAQIIDINMGCPAKKVCNRLCGSALLTDEDLVAKILSTVVAASSVPVTLKTRTGFRRDTRNGVRIAQLAESCGIAALAVHGRTREDFYDGDAEYETIREIRSRVKIPLFANGDIDSPKKARAVLDFTGATGVMLGRAAHGSPWIFRDVNYFLSHGKIAPALPLRKVGDTILAHLESLYDVLRRRDWCSGSTQTPRLVFRKVAGCTRCPSGVDVGSNVGVAVCGDEKKSRWTAERRDHRCNLGRSCNVCTMMMLVVVFRLEHRRWGVRNDGENFSDPKRFRSERHARSAAA